MWFLIGLKKLRILCVWKKSKIRHAVCVCKISWFIESEKFIRIYWKSKSEWKCSKNKFSAILFCLNTFKSEIKKKSDFLHQKRILCFVWKLGPTLVHVLNQHKKYLWKFYTQVNKHTRKILTLKSVTEVRNREDEKWNYFRVYFYVFHQRWVITQLSEGRPLSQVLSDSSSSHHLIKLWWKNTSLSRKIG